MNEKSYKLLMIIVLFAFGMSDVDIEIMNSLGMLECGVWKIHLNFLLQNMSFEKIYRMKEKALKPILKT